MKIISNKFSVTDFNIDGFLSLAPNQYIIQQNKAEYQTGWVLPIDSKIAYLSINAIYTPKSKVDFSILANYTAKNSYTAMIDNLDNEKDEIDKIVISFVKELADEYNKRLRGTRIQISFPVTPQEVLDQFCQHIISSLHKAIERLRNLPPQQ